MRGAMLTLNMKTPCCGAEKRPVSLLYAWPKLVTTVSNITSVPSSVLSSGTLRVAMKATRGTLSLRPSRRDEKKTDNGITEHKSRSHGAYRRCPEFLRAEGRVISQVRTLRMCGRRGGRKLSLIDSCHAKHFLRASRSPRGATRFRPCVKGRGEAAVTSKYTHTRLAGVAFLAARASFTYMGIHGLHTSTYWVLWLEVKTLLRAQKYRQRRRPHRKILYTTVKTNGRLLLVQYRTTGCSKALYCIALVFPNVHL